MFNKIRSLVKIDDVERAEALPGAIVSAIVSAIILLGLASTLALVVQNQKAASITADVVSSGSNIESRFNSDESNSSYIQPNSPYSVSFSAPIDNSTDCKVATWQVENALLTRTLTVYSNTFPQLDGKVKCRTETAIKVDQKKIMTSQLDEGAEFTFFNAAGREMLVSTDGSMVFRSGGTGCVLNMDPINDACPDVPQTVADSWNSKVVQDVKIAYNITGASNR